MEAEIKPLNQKAHKTIILYSDDLGKVQVALNFALTAVAMGFGATIFFTYWGLNVLRKERPGIKTRRTLAQKLLLLLMPRGPSRLFFPQVHCFGLGTWLMKRAMKRHQVMQTSELLDNAKRMGVKLIACQLCLDVLGLGFDELIDGIERGGMATCLESVDQSNVSLFI